MPQAVLAAQAKEEKKIPLMNRAQIGLSIKHPQKGKEELQAVATAQAAQVQRQLEGDSPFDEQALNFYWQEYAGALPLEYKATAMRMQNLRPSLLKDATFEVVVDNEMIAKDFTAMIPNLQTYLGSRLKNSQVQMRVRISEAMENVRAFGRVEKFQMMAQKNSALLQLKEVFGLELY